MVIANFRCKDCQDRYPGCHDHCATYKEDKAAHDKRRYEERLKREASMYIYNHVGDVLDNVAKRRRDKAGYSRFGKGSG